MFRERIDEKEGREVSGRHARDAVRKKGKIEKKDQRVALLFLVLLFFLPCRREGTTRPFFPFRACLVGENFFSCGKTSEKILCGLDIHMLYRYLTGESFPFNGIAASIDTNLTSRQIFSTDPRDPTTWYLLK